MLRAVIFDLDNTLIDFNTFKVSTVRAAARAMVKQGLPASPFEARDRIYEVYKRKGIEYDRTYEEVVKSFGLDDKNLAARVQEAAVIAHQKATVVALVTYPMVKMSLRILRAMRLKLAVISDAPREKVWRRLVKTGLEEFFDVVVTHSDTQAHKPHPLPFQLALEKLGVKAEDCLFIGDHPGRDIKGAKEVGMRTCLAAYGSARVLRGQDTYQNNDNVKADFTIERFEDFLPLVVNMDAREELRAGRSTPRLCNRTTRALWRAASAHERARARVAGLARNIRGF